MAQVGDTADDICVEELPAHRSTFTAGRHPAVKIQIGADQRRPAQCVQNTSLLWLLPRNAEAETGSNPRRIRIIAGETPCKGPDQLAIRVAPQHLEPGHPSLVETLPIVLQ